MNEGSVLHLYFVLGGLIAACLGIALLIDFKGLGRTWEEGVTRNSAYINKISHLPWPPNPAIGRVYRKYAGGFGVFIGIVLIVTGVVGMR